MQWLVAERHQDRALRRCRRRHEHRGDGEHEVERDVDERGGVSGVPKQPQLASEAPRDRAYATTPAKET